MSKRQHVELLIDFPPSERPAYHEGMGDLEPREDAEYGKRRIVGRVAFHDYTRAEALVEFEKRGVKHEIVFPTARFWCAAVYE